MMAQEVNIPDPGLNAAIRDALQKPIGPLTETGLLSLTALNASGRCINSVEGLQAARNLTSLDLDLHYQFRLPERMDNSGNAQP